MRKTLLSQITQMSQMSSQSDSQEHHDEERYQFVHGSIVQSSQMISGRLR